MTCFDKLFHAQKHPNFGSQILSCFGFEYVESYLALGGAAPKVRGFGE